jgi:hypothetical protein
LQEGRVISGLLRFAPTKIGTFRTVVYPVRLRNSALGERLSPFFGDGETPDAVIARLAARWPGYGLRARVAVGQKIQTRQKRQRGEAQRVQAKCGRRFSGLISFFHGITLKLRCLSSISQD